MKRTIGIASLSLLLGLAVILEFGAGRPAQPPAAPDPAYVPGQVLVKFKSTVSPGMKAALISLTKSRVLSRFLEFNLYVVQIPEEAAVEDMVSFYGRNPSVAYAQPNYFYQAAVTPNDALFVYQYALYNRGQEIGWFPGSPQGNPNADIKALAAWEETTGSEDVTIAILDTGIDLIHPDLKNKLKSSGRDVVNNDFDATDDNGHGTMVAGIAAAESNNSEGIAGVAWKCKILPVKVLDANGIGVESKIIEGIVYAVQNGAKIINLSFGAPVVGQAMRDALRSAFETNGVFIAAAAGNDNTTVYYPAAWDDYVCAVAATDFNDQRWSQSNFGASIDVAAPGIQIFTTHPVGMTPPGRLPYIFANGTSLACAHVSGLAALVKSIKPTLSPLQIMNIIRYAADDVNSAIYPGKDEFLGYGRINMEKTLVPLKIIE